MAKWSLRGIPKRLKEAWGIPVDQKFILTGRHGRRSKKTRKFHRVSRYLASLKSRTRRPDAKQWCFLRRMVFSRDGWTCQYCGATRDRALLQVDHIVPVSRGGSNKLRNLITACEPCNSAKAAKMPSRKQIVELDEALMSRYDTRKKLTERAAEEDRELGGEFLEKMNDPNA